MLESLRVVAASAGRRCRCHLRARCYRPVVCAAVRSATFLTYRSGTDVMPRVYETPPPGYGYPAPYGPYGVPMRTVKTSVGGLGTALTILLGLDAALAALDTGALAWRNSIINSLLGDRLSVDRSTVDDSDNLVGAASGFLIIGVLGTIVVFICWFWAARSNAELYAPNSGGMSIGWAIGGGVIPPADRGIPFIVARGIHSGPKRGRPGKPPGGGESHRRWGGPPVPPGGP